VPNFISTPYLFLMHPSKESFDYFVKKILPVYGFEEAKSIAFLFFETTFSFTKTDILVNKNLPFLFDFEPIIARLIKAEPIQFILGEALFFGRKFLVNKNTLIPRPETEELVDIAIIALKKMAKTKAHLTVLDIGTGTGCIAISLAKSIDNLKVTAWDISEEALKIAEENNVKNEANVIFEKKDILANDLESEKTFDLIISNPPYVTMAEKSKMQPNVLNFEPHLALFVANNNPLQFYKSIGFFAFKQLNKNGVLMLEINENFGYETAKLLMDIGFNSASIIKDFHGKERMIVAKTV
jgi:release factor glutamine methyltransferase